MLKPEHLRAWQPQASERQLAEFAEQNATLLRLLEEAWHKFAAETAPAPPLAEYAAGVAPEDLRHDEVTPEQLAAFYNHFEREREHNDRPFGDHVPIREQDWTLT